MLTTTHTHRKPAPFDDPTLHLLAELAELDDSQLRRGAFHESLLYTPTSQHMLDVLAHRVRLH
jgi:hypothetical protein